MFGERHGRGFQDSSDEQKEIQAIQENFEKRHEQSLKMLKLRKEEVVRKIIEHIDKLRANLSEDKTDQDTEIQKEIETIEINIDMIQNIQDDVNETSTLEEIKIKREIVNNVCEEIQKRKANRKSYTLLEYHTGQLNAGIMENLCGKTIKREIPLTFSKGQILDESTIVEQQDYAQNYTNSSADQEINKQQKPAGRRSYASQMKQNICYSNPFMLSNQSKKPQTRIQIPEPGSNRYRFLYQDYIQG